MDLLVFKIPDRMVKDEVVNLQGGFLMKKILGIVVLMLLVVQTALASPTIVDIKPKDITKDPMVKEYAAAIWEAFQEPDPDFITVVNGEGMPRIIIQVDAMSIPKQEGQKEEQFVYGVVLAADLYGSDMVIFLSQTVGVANKSEMKKIAATQARDIKTALKSMPGMLRALDLATGGDEKADTSGEPKKQ